MIDAALIEAARGCRGILSEKKALDILLLDLRKINSYIDFMIICTASSKMHARSLARDIKKEMPGYAYGSGVQSSDESDWTLLDYGFMTVNIFTFEAREFYALDRLWGDAGKL